MKQLLISGGAALRNRWKYPWGDKARAASLAARRAKAAARLAAGSGGRYADGNPVIADLTRIGEEYPRGYESQTTLSDSSRVEARQARYEAAFRRWWSGVETTSENIAAFHAFVAAVGGAAAAASGAYSRGAHPTFGAEAMKAYAARRGVVPVYGREGEYVGLGQWERPDGSTMRASAARRGPGEALMTAPPSGVPARGRPRVAPGAPYGGLPQSAFYGARSLDLLNDPKTADDYAFRASYERYRDELESDREAYMLSRGLDPQGYPLASGVREEFGLGTKHPTYGLPAAADTGDEALALIRRYGEVLPLARTDAEREAVENAGELLGRYVELYEDEQLERAEKEGLLPSVREALSVFDAAAPLRVAEAAPAYLTAPGPDALPVSRAARDAARALGVLHGAYGVDASELPPIPSALMEEYDLGRAEGVRGYDYGVAVPHDRAAVFRRVQAYLDGTLSDEDGYYPEHLNDRYNLQDWGSAASWATRNQGKASTYRPGTIDTRAQYSPANLLRTALAWFEEALVRGDRPAANAALAYMGDLVVSLAGDRQSAVEAARGAPEGEPEADDDALEEDSRMQEYDEDGNEVGGESPFFEDSYADPNARHPAEGLDEAFESILRKAARQGVHLSNRWWKHRPWDDNDRAKARLARRRNNEARKKADKEELKEKREEAARLRGRSLSEIYPDEGWGDDKGPAGEYDGAGNDRAWRAGAEQRAFNAKEAGALAARAREAREAADKAGGDDPALNAAADAAERAAFVAGQAANAPAGGLPAGAPEWASSGNPLGLAWNEDGSIKEGGITRTTAPHPRRVLPPNLPAVGFSVPESQVVFYSDGNLYDRDGRWVAEAPETPVEGEVFQDGRWYDAATGRTTGAGAAASSSRGAVAGDPPPRRDPQQGDLASAGRDGAAESGSAGSGGLSLRPPSVTAPSVAVTQPRVSIPGVSARRAALAGATPPVDGGSATSSNPDVEAWRSRIMTRGARPRDTRTELSDYGFAPEKHFASRSAYNRFFSALPTMELKREFGRAYDRHLQRTLSADQYAALVSQAQAVLAAASAHNDALFSGRV